MTNSTQESCLSHGIKRCGLHICVLGVIGSGKTTLSKALQRVIIEDTGHCYGLYEPVDDNPLLPLFYSDPKRYAFAMQVNMLNRRLEQQKIAQDMAKAGICSVQDSSLFGDSCFVEMLKKDGIMSKEEVDVYSELFINMTDNVMYPSMVIYLDCDPEVAKKRIEKRGRECESGVSVEYLSSLKTELDKLIEEFKRYSFVHVVDANKELTEEEIVDEAVWLYEVARQSRETPIISRIGV